MWEKNMGLFFLGVLCLQEQTYLDCQHTHIYCDPCFFCGSGYLCTTHRHRCFWALQGT